MTDLESDNPWHFFLNIIAIFALIAFILFFIHISLKVIPLWTPIATDDQENLIINELSDSRPQLNAAPLVLPKEDNSTKNVSNLKTVNEMKMSDPNHFYSSSSGGSTNFHSDDVYEPAQPLCLNAAGSNSAEWTI